MDKKIQFQKDTKFQSDTDFYFKSLNRSAEVLGRTGKEIILKQNKQSVNDHHSNLRAKHTRKSSGYEPLGQLHNISYLQQQYQEKVKTFDLQGEENAPIQRRTRINLKLPIDQKIRYESSVDRVKMMIEKKRNPKNPQLQKEIQDSHRRKQKAERGNGLINITEFTASKIAKDMADNMKISSKKWERDISTPPELKSYRNHKLLKKLNYFVESPRSLNRRLETEHLPWGIQPDIPDDPEAEVFRPDSADDNRELIKQSTHHVRQSSQNFSKTWARPELLGSEGLKLLVNIMSDAENNVKVTEGELKIIKSIVNRRASIMNIRQSRHASIMLTEMNLVDAVRNPHIKAGTLVDRYFSASNIDSTKSSLKTLPDFQKKACLTFDVGTFSRQ